MILLALSLIWGSALGLLLTPALVVVLDKRFIKPEEARLSAAFGEAFEVYRGQVRKWF
jgi:protein-S-isoprenylcysteine O-methyltransferase Ste14